MVPGDSIFHQQFAFIFARVAKFGGSRASVGIEWRVVGLTVQPVTVPWSKRKRLLDTAGTARARVANFKESKRVRDRPIFPHPSGRLSCDCYTE